MEDTRTPTWAWMIVLLPLFVLLFISVAVYVGGYSHAKVLSASLVPIDATVISVKADLCGGRSRHACYRVKLQGSIEGIDHEYHTYDVPNGRFFYVKSEDGNLSVIDHQRVQKILVAPHPGNSKISKMYWSRDDPVEEFKTNSTILLLFIAFEIFMCPFGFWCSARQQAARNSHAVE
jgi:hypothetical protein